MQHEEETPTPDPADGDDDIVGSEDTDVFHKGDGDREDKETREGDTK